MQSAEFPWMKDLHERQAEAFLLELGSVFHVTDDELANPSEDDDLGWGALVTKIDAVVAKWREASTEDLADDACVDNDGNVYPEHDYREYDCHRCGAEPDNA